MRQTNYQPIVKARREHFGGIVFREAPAFVAYINNDYADAYGIAETRGAIMRDGVFSAPLDAHLAITTRCNMFCKGCYNTREGDKPEDISMGTARAVIDKLSSMNVLSLSFGGGEPTLHPGIFEIAAYAREKQILPNMTTNGLAMTEQFAMNCSVFGNVHFSIHKMQDVDAVVAAMQIYRKTTGKKPGLNLLLTTETLPNIDGILSRTKRAGAKKVLFLRYKTTAKNTDSQDLCIDKELNRFPAQLKKLSRKYKQMMFLFDCSLFELIAESGISDFDTYSKFDFHGCLGGNAYIAVDVNGMYKPCSFWREPFGSVLDLDFPEWIHDQKLNDFRGMRRDESCTHCEFVTLCAGGCRLLYEA